MTGQELFAALSFVDEKYIHEAETASLHRNTPWLKVLSVAACLCVLLVGAFAMTNMGHKGATEEAAAPAAPEAMLEEAAPAATAPPVQDQITTESAAEPVTIPGELHHIPYARLRIVNILDNGSFEVVMEEISEDPALLEVGMQVTMVVDPAMIPQPDRTDTAYEENITEDMLVEIRNGAYDRGINTLYVEGAIPAD